MIDLLSSYQTSHNEHGTELVDWATLPPRKPYRIFLTNPNAGSIMPCAEQSIVHASNRKHSMCVDPRQFGDIEHNFNMAFCDAINNRASQGITHFAMCHSDIGAQAHWLDTLIEEMDRVNADIMTTVVPIKDIRGLTTTGIRYPGIWGTRRFTMREISRFPETFSVHDTDEPDAILAINTGLWVCRLPMNSWPDTFPGFTCKHKIVSERGQRVPWFDSEDWLFSDWAHEQGLRVFATRKVRCFHRGGNDFYNEGTWGMWETEQQRPRRPLSRALESPGITVETEKPIAVDSLDHTQPLGARQDNHVNYAFNRKLFRLIPAADVRLLDLGCAGGGFVRTILEAGGFAIGIDGSDFPKSNALGEWPTIPEHLFTADLTARVDILPKNEPHIAGIFAVKFNVITAWEFMEHIAEKDLYSLLDNITRHASDGMLFITSISQSREPHHQTVQPKEWWIDAISANLLRAPQFNFVHAPDLEAHFGDDLVRGSNQEGALSRSVIFRCHAR